MHLTTLFQVTQLCVSKNHATSWLLFLKVQHIREISQKLFLISFFLSITGYMFFECPSVGDYFEYLWNEQVWLWALWFISQIWITAHIWSPLSPKLASTEQIFGTPWYCSLFLDQSLILNRRNDGEEELRVSWMLSI